MELRLRKVATHRNASNAYQVFYEELAIGTIGLHLLADNEEQWRWAIYYTPTRAEGLTVNGIGESREHCMELFKEAWQKFCRNPERLEQFLHDKRYSADRPWNKNKRF